MTNPAPMSALKQMPGFSLIELGFSPVGAKCLRRICGDICQYLFVKVETRIRREFLIEYCSILRCVPQTSTPLAHGGGLPFGKEKKWYRADTDNNLARSIEQIAADWPRLIDWLECAATVDGFLRTYKERLATGYEAIVRNGHSSFTLACGHASIGDFEAAIQHAKQAQLDFLTIFKRQECNWALEGNEHCSLLLNAISEGTVPSLLERWRRFTEVALKLPATFPEQ